MVSKVRCTGRQNRYQKDMHVLNSGPVVIASVSPITRECSMMPICSIYYTKQLYQPSVPQGSVMALNSPKSRRPVSAARSPPPPRAQHAHVPHDGGFAAATHRPLLLRHRPPPPPAPPTAQYPDVRVFMATVRTLSTLETGGENSVETNIQRIVSLSR